MQFPLSWGFQGILVIIFAIPVLLCAPPPPQSFFAAELDEAFPVWPRLVIQQVSQNLFQHLPTSLSPLLLSCLSGRSPTFLASLSSLALRRLASLSWEFLCQWPTLTKKFQGLFFAPEWPGIFPWTRRVSYLQPLGQRVWGQGWENFVHAGDACLNNAHPQLYCTNHLPLLYNSPHAKRNA